MPWLTIIMTLISFFLAGGSDPNKRGKAAAIALGVGAATYGITRYTDWGRETLGTWDGLEFETNADGVVVGTTPDGETVQSLPAKDGGTTTVSGSSGLWGSIGGFLSSTGGQIAALTAGAAIAGVPGWLVVGGAIAAVYVVTK